MIDIQIVNDSLNELPKYATPDSSGVDLKADFSKGLNENFMFGSAFDEKRETLLLFSGGRCLIPTNIKTAIPEGYEVQIRPRSGLALKSGITVLNTPGTIDSDFRNNWGIILINFSDDVFEIKQGDRIAQAVLMKTEKINWVNTIDLTNTERGLGGFGSTGKN